MQRPKRVKDLPLINRYPRTGVAILTTAALTIFFSKPIYDFCVVSKEQIDVEELKRTHKSRFSKS